MKTDVISQCQKCKSCAVVSKTKRHMEPIVPLEIQAFSVGEMWSSDIFSLGGKNYLVCVDKISGIIFASIMKNMKAETVTGLLENWISMLGLPSVLKTDGATSYTAGLFEQFCDKLGILHVVSSPYNAEGNGQSERAVQELKIRLERSKGELKLNEIIIIMNETERAGGYRSPISLFLGRNIRSPLPNS